MSSLYQYGNVNPQYVDAGCPAQCFGNNEYSELSDYYGAVPIPPSTAIRIYNTPLSVNPQTYQIQNPTELTDQQMAKSLASNAQAAAQAAKTAQAAAQQAQAAVAHFIRTRQF